MITNDSKFLLGLLEGHGAYKAVSLFFAFFICMIFILKATRRLNAYLQERLNILHREAEEKEKLWMLVETCEERITRLEEKQQTDTANSIRHDEKIEASIQKILENMDSHFQKNDARTVATCRSTLYRLHKEFSEQGYVTESGLKTFNEIGKVYEDAGGDDIYHEKLYPEVISLELVNE